MSILFGYDYFDTPTEDMNTLKQRLTTTENDNRETQRKSSHVRTILKN
jgi:hypothetical protein